MDKVQAVIRQAEIDATIVKDVRLTLESLKLLHSAELVLPNTNIIVDLQKDIDRLTLALLLLGYSDE